jgi:hypothetical protein
VTTDYITPVLYGMLDSVVAHFKASGRPGFCRAALVGGEAAWDDCCDCGTGDGQVYVRLVSMLPLDEESTWNLDHNCGPAFNLTVAVGVLRCVPGLDGEGNIPTAEAETAAAVGVHRDAVSSRAAIDCLWAERDDTDDYAYRWTGWTALGYEGYCGGGEHTFDVQIGPCACS